MRHGDLIFLCHVLCWFKNRSIAPCVFFASFNANLILKTIYPNRNLMGPAIFKG